MTTSKNKKIIYWTLYGLIFVFTAYFAFTFISKSIAEKKDFEIFKESWQYVADTNFKQSVEIDPETNEQKVYYEISTPEQLAGAFLSESSVSAENTSTISNRTYRLTNNVDLKGKTWQVESTFTQTFDGNSYHVQNLTINDKSISSYSARILGFVGTLRGTIKNLYFDNLNVSTSKWDTKCYIGGIAGIMESGIISNVYINSGYICGSYLGSYSTFNQDREVGGIVGFLSGGKIKNSINKARLDYGKHIGGIVGFMNNGTITNCINQGNVCASDGVYMRVGGIAGEISGGTLKLCENTGEIYTTIDPDEVNCTNLSIGGIVGVASVTIEQCANKGDVDGGDEYACAETMVGGIAGQSLALINDCYNTGNISGSADSKTFSDTDISNNNINVKVFDGVGYAYVYDIYIVHGNYISSAWNDNGKYKETKHRSKYYDRVEQNKYIGGICGYSSGYRISSCYNIGKIDTSNSEIKRYVTLYFKWRAQKGTGGEFHLLLEETFNYGIGYRYDSICPTSIKSNCYDNSGIKSYIEYSKVNLTQRQYSEGKLAKTNNIENNVVQGTNSGRRCDWYLEDANGASYNTIHGVTVNNKYDNYYDTIGYNINFWAEYISEYNNKPVTYYYSYPINNLGYYVSAAQNSNNTINSMITGDEVWDNTGTLPSLKGLYW